MKNVELLRVTIFKALLGFALLHTNAAIAQNACANHIKAKIELGAEYLIPTNENHTINTASFNAFFWTRYLKKVKLNVDIGMTATYASGKILDWYSIFPPLLYRKTVASGIGPVLHFRHDLLEIGKLSVGFEGSGGIILYNTNFPVGGDIYNFMFRAGAIAGYRVNENVSLNAGYKWMHVSNGQGTVPHNPAYEAKGWSLSLTKYFLSSRVTTITQRSDETH